MTFSHPINQAAQMAAAAAQSADTPLGPLPEWSLADLYPAMDSAGIQRKARAHGFHMFRHSAGSIVHAKTGNLKLAQKLLGHARISTTSDIYVHVPENLADLATEVIAGELNCAQIVPKSEESIN